MRKTSTLPRVAGSMPQARPVFLSKRPRFVTRRDWSPVLWAVAALGLAAVSFLGVSALLLGA